MGAMQPFRFVLVSLVGLLLLVTSGLAWSQEQGLVPVVRGGLTHDFGEIQQGEVLDHTFELEARGTKPLLITKIKSSCGCLTSSIQFQSAGSAVKLPYVIGTNLKPGSRLFIDARMKTDGLNGPTKKLINVKFADGSLDFSLALDADVHPILVVSPNAYVGLGSRPANEPLAASFEVSSPKLGKFDLAQRMRGAPKDVEVKLVPVRGIEGEKAEVWRVDVHVDAPGTDGQKTWMIGIETKARIPGFTCSARNYSRTLTVQAFLQGTVSVQPTSLRFGMIERGKPAKLESTITVHDGHRLPAKIEALIVANRTGDGIDYSKSFKVEVEVDASGQSARVVLSLGELPEDFVGTFAGTIQVSLKHPDKPVVQIPFNGMVRGGF